MNDSGNKIRSTKSQFEHGTLVAYIYVTNENKQINKKNFDFVFSFPFLFLCRALD